uniref:Entericidin n=1 Tax=Paraburkholderia sprentiae WSM5005 TaxID=754502 RepID=A0A1I9YUB1_9BURK
MRGAEMKRFILAVLLLMPLTCGVASCQKAHKAGNDSMNAGGAKIDVSASAPVDGAAGARR